MITKIVAWYRFRKIKKELQKTKKFIY
jgi:hypothetical protein